MATRQCKLCGAIMEDVAINRIYCDDCRLYIKEHRVKTTKIYRHEHKNCRNCRFYEGECCSYIFIVGHSRPCPPGDKCTVKEKIKK